MTSDMWSACEIDTGMYRVINIAKTELKNRIINIKDNERNAKLTNTTLQLTIQLTINKQHFYTFLPVLINVIPSTGCAQ